MMHTDKFFGFLSGIQTPANESLIEAIKSGFVALHEDIGAIQRSNVVGTPGAKIEEGEYRQVANTLDKAVKEFGDLAVITAIIKESNEYEVPITQDEINIAIDAADWMAHPEASSNPRTLGLLAAAGLITPDIDLQKRLVEKSSGKEAIEYRGGEAAGEIAAKVYSFIEEEIGTNFTELVKEAKANEALNELKEFYATPAGKADIERVKHYGEQMKSDGWKVIVDDRIPTIAVDKNNDTEGGYFLQGDEADAFIKEMEQKEEASGIDFDNLVLEYLGESGVLEG